MRKSKNLLIVSFLISLITIFVYLPALQNDFVNWDDDEYVYENPYIQSINLKSIKWMFTAFHSANWHPLTWLSHTIDYAIWGLNPMGHHLTSIIFHGLNTFLIVILISNLINLARSNYQKNTLLIVGAVTGVLFGLHPIHVESVVWASERKDVLCAFFFLLSILAYLRYTSALKKKAGLYVSCLVFFMLSLMSKPMAVTLPLVLLILDVYPLRRMRLRNFTDSWRVIGEKVPLFVLSGISVVLTVIAQRAGETIQSLEYYPLGDRLLVGIRALGFYLFKMVWPSGLVPFYPYPSKISFFMQEFFLSFLTITVITILCILTWKKQKVWAVAWGYYVITLLPVLGIIQVGEQAAADRYTYIPSIGPFIFTGLGVAFIWEKIIEKHRLLHKWVFLSFSLVVILMLIVTTVKQTRMWKDSIMLWSKELKIYPEVALAHNNLGNAYKYKGLIDNAIEHYQNAIKLDPYYARAHYNLGFFYENQGLINKAIREYQITIELIPNHISAHQNVGFAYFKKGDIDKAIYHLEYALRLNPNVATVHLNLGIAYKSKGLINKANEHLRIVRQLNPNFYKTKGSHK